MFISPEVRFWLYFPILIPSIICSIFVLFHLLSDRALRNALHNHVIIIMVFVALLLELTDVIWLVHYYRVRTALIKSPVFCLIWVYLDVSGFITVSILVAWASVERHILIFHDKWLSTRRKRLFIHYIPLVIFFLYPLVFYFYLFFFINCQQPFNYNINRCGYSYCPLYDPTIGTYDSITNGILPTLCIVTFSVLLIIRVLWQKRILRQRIRWLNYRRMTIQLLSISSIYIIFYFPVTILYISYVSGVSLSASALDYYSASIYFTPHIFMSIPIVSIISLPELCAKVKRLIGCGQRSMHVIYPEILEMNHGRTNQPTKSPVAKAFPRRSYPNANR